MSKDPSNLRFLFKISRDKNQKINLRVDRVQWYTISGMKIKMSRKKDIKGYCFHCMEGGKHIFKKLLAQ